MKQYTGFLAIVLMTMAFSCGEPDPAATPTPTRNPSNTAVPNTPTTVPTEVPTVTPPTATVPQPTSTVPIPTIPPIAVAELVPPLPKLIGFVQLGDMADPLDFNSFNFQSNDDTAKQLIISGFQAAHLWPEERVQSADLQKVICNPKIRVIAIRPMARSGRDSDNCEEGVKYKTTWENEDFGQTAWDLLDMYGDLACRGGVPLDIILNNWEGDWQLKGPFCRDRVPPDWRRERVTAMYDTRQSGIEWARAEFPNAKLRVFHGVVVNHRLDSYPVNVTRDIIPSLKHKPDLIGLSYYGEGGDETFAQAVAQIKKYTNYPVSRMYVAEHGRSENYVGRQQQLFEESLPAMDAEGIRLIFVWMWKQYWPGNAREDGTRTGDWFGNWVVDENSGKPIQDSFTGEWTSGLKFLSTFRMSFEETPLPAVTPPVGGTATPTRTATSPPATPTRTPTVNPCAQCPAWGTIGCVINETACIQCWANCGQPVGTPTKTPTSTRTPTPTVNPSNPCASCPAPGSVQCRLYEDSCYICWSNCGQPLPTRTPTPIPPTPTATRTPTPNYSDNPLISAQFEGYPVTCTWLFTHVETQQTISKLTPGCSGFNQKFPLTGSWLLEMTAQYAHEAEGGLNAKHTKPNGDEYGDLDGDKLYEYRVRKTLVVEPRPTWVPIA